MKKKAFRDAINRLTSQWSTNYQKEARPVIKRITELLKLGFSVQGAVDKAIIETGFIEDRRAALLEAIYQAAAEGYGIDPAVISAGSKTLIIKKLSEMPWTGDRMPLSQRLHGSDGEMRRLIEQTISKQVKAGTNFIKAARALYDGYGYGRVINPAELPKYLQELTRASQRLAGGLLDIEAQAEFRKALKIARRNVGDLSQDGAPTRALKAAYNRLLKAAETLNQKAIDKAVYVAVNEKARYHAERISRTEIARAWADGFLTSTLNDPYVIALKWRLSSRHPRFDICDVHSKANLFGLGPGVFPKNAVPPCPAHPHCGCRYEEVFDGELDGLKMSEDVRWNGAKYFRKLSKRELLDLFGYSGLENIKEGADWRLFLRNWQGLEDPAPRLTKSDFKEQ